MGADKNKALYEQVSNATMVAVFLAMAMLFGTLDLRAQSDRAVRQIVSIHWALGPADRQSRWSGSRQLRRASRRLW